MQICLTLFMKLYRHIVLALPTQTYQVPTWIILLVLDWYPRRDFAELVYIDVFYMRVLKILVDELSPIFILSRVEVTYNIGVYIG
jgi:hypothetical protein